MTTMLPLFVIAAAGFAYLAHNDPSYRAGTSRRALVVERISSRSA